MIISQWTYLSDLPMNAIQSEPLEVTGVVHTVIITFPHHTSHESAATMHTHPPKYKTPAAL